MTSEWTSVRPKKSRRAGRPPTATPALQALEPTSPASATSTPEEIRKAHEGYKEAYILSDVHRAVQGILPGDIRIKKAVCLGVGSFDAAGGWAARRKAHLQVLAFLDLVGDRGVECFFQEPAFTEADGKFLEGLGYTVVRSPVGFDMVDEETLVFGVHLYAPIYDLALEKGLPAVFIGTGWESWDDVRLSSKTKKPLRIKEMHEVSKMVEFPQDDAFTFSSTVVYWRVRGDEVESKEPESKELESKESEPKEPESKEPEPKEPEPKKPESKKPKPEESESKEPEPKKPESKDPMSEESKPKEPESEESESKKPNSTMPTSKPTP